MSFTYLRELPSPGKIKTEYPLSKEMQALFSIFPKKKRLILSVPDFRSFFGVKLHIFSEAKCTKSLKCGQSALFLKNTPCFFVQPEL